MSDKKMMEICPNTPMELGNPGEAPPLYTAALADPGFENPAFGTPGFGTPTVSNGIKIHNQIHGNFPLGMEPMRIQCPNCEQRIVTVVTTRSSIMTHYWALVLCVALCWPLVCVPYCCASCKDAYHSCPNCHTDLGLCRA